MNSAATFDFVPQARFMRFHFKLSSHQIASAPLPEIHFANGFNQLSGAVTGRRCLRI
jgi:hypothetical protein